MSSTERWACAMMATLFLGAHQPQGPSLEASHQVETRFAASKDGTRIAYDVTGSGPALILLHGGGQTRNVWHESGYVARLRDEFTVITVDLRGNGESDKPTTIDAYAIDRLRDDVLTVADAAGASRFGLWGFSYGANIGRYVASESDRVIAMVYIGIPFGAAASGAFGESILAMRAKWTPVVEAHNAGRLDVASLPEADRATWRRGNVPLSLAWLSAMLEYPPVEPRDMKCPTLWIVGTKNDGAMASAQAYEDALAPSRVSLGRIEGLTHADELSQIEKVLPIELAFTRQHLRPSVPCS